MVFGINLRIKWWYLKRTKGGNKGWNCFSLKNDGAESSPGCPAPRCPAGRPHPRVQGGHGRQAGRQGQVWVRADLADAVVPQTPPLLITCSCPHRASLAIGLGAQVFLLFFILASNWRGNWEKQITCTVLSAFLSKAPNSPAGALSFLPRTVCLTQGHRFFAGESSQALPCPPCFPHAGSQGREAKWRNGDSELVVWDVAGNEGRGPLFSDLPSNGHCFKVTTVPQGVRNDELYSKLLALVGVNKWCLRAAWIKMKQPN